MADSPAISHFTMAAAIIGPGGWLVSQIFLVLYNWLDSGANTCGIDFHYDNPVKKRKCFSNCCSSDDKAEEEEEEASSNQGSIVQNEEIRQPETDINQVILDYICKAEYKFQSETGR
jgi:hypothetical protein